MMMAASITGSNSSTRPGYSGLKPISPNKMDSSKASSVAWKSRSVPNGSKIHCMKTWTPINNTKYETLSYLPPLSDESIAKQIDYMISKGWIPCLEFDEVGKLRRENSRIPGYYEGRYWTLWKLPMFGCNDASRVLSEIHHCRNAFPTAHIRCLGFDNERQVQCMAFLVQKPPSSSSS